MVFIIAIAVLIIYIAAAVSFANVADMKGCEGQRGTVIWLSLLLGPAGWIYAAALPDRYARPVKGKTAAPSAAEKPYEKPAEKQYVPGEDLPDL